MFHCYFQDFINTNLQFYEFHNTTPMCTPYMCVMGKILSSRIIHSTPWVIFNGFPECKKYYLCFFVLSLVCSFIRIISITSVSQSCQTPCNPMDYSMPGFPVHHQLPELAHTHVHQTVSSSIIPFSSCLQSFPAPGSFPVSQFFISGGQSIGVSASVSVLPMNIQDWFSLG